MRCQTAPSYFSSFKDTRALAGPPRTLTSVVMSVFFAKPSQHRLALENYLQALVSTPELRGSTTAAQASGRAGAGCDAFASFMLGVGAIVVGEGWSVFESVSSPL